MAFLTHLSHPDEIPIIDQHNFRAMNYLLNHLGYNSQSKKKPSNWNDIIQLKDFMNVVCKKIKKEHLELDKFLMMYGRSLPR